MEADGQAFDTIVVGGGPGALAEVLALRRAGRRPLAVAQRFGGCMEMLGSQPLQSYVSELSLADAPIRLEDVLSSRTACCPSGREYARYIRTSFELACPDRLQATVEEVAVGARGLEVRVSENGRSRTLVAARVVLATGLRPKPPDSRIPPDAWRTCFQAYEDLAREEFAPYAGRTVVIVGSGNTAFQLARCMTRLAARVIVLVKEYLGVYPIESTDRFSLRAPTLPALELAAKTAQAHSPLGPVNPKRNALCPLWLFACGGLGHDAQAARLRVTVGSGEALPGVLRESSAAALAAGLLERADGGALACSLDAHATTLVSAIGVAGNAPRVPEGLIDAKTGFARHEHGRTCVPGLFVAGSLAGYASVNQMHLAAS